jgi:hypothetical protein
MHLFSCIYETIGSFSVVFYLSLPTLWHTTQKQSSKGMPHESLISSIKETLLLNMLNETIMGSQYVKIAPCTQNTVPVVRHDADLLQPNCCMIFTCICGCFACFIQWHPVLFSSLSFQNFVHIDVAPPFRACGAGEQRNTRFISSRGCWKIKEM